MRIAFLTDPLASFKIYKDSTYAMMVEADKRGHSLFVFQQSDMAYKDGAVVANVTPIILTEDSVGWYRAAAPSACALATFDLVIQRKDPPFNMEYLYMTYLLERAELEGARIVNRPSALRNHNEKLAITEFPQFIAPTLVTSDEQRLRFFHTQYHDVIFKPLDGMGGAGIFRVNSEGVNLGSIIETLTQNGTRTIMAQRYIPEITKGDKRILLIGGHIVPFALARIPQAGEVRGNLAVGGLGVAQLLSARDRQIAEALAPILSQRGLLLVGLDVIGDYLTEINVTSPTCFQEISQQTGTNVAGLFMDVAEQIFK